MSDNQPKESGLVSRIEDVLRQEKLDYEVSPFFGGVQPDFLIHTSDGRAIVIEAKSWTPNPNSLNRAKHEANLYQTAVGANGAFVVVEGLKNSRPKEGVVALDGLIPALQRAIRNPTNRRKPPKVTGSKPTVFAAMPFAAEYDDVFFFGMAKAAAAAGATCKRVDKEEFEGDIVNEIERLIHESTAVIVDLSQSKPNVLYEAGYAHALHKPCIHICSPSTRNLPFDVSHKNTIPYKIGQIHILKPKLRDRLKAVLL